MKKTLTKHGNSYALIIDKPIMDLLRIQPDTQLEIETDGTALIVRPALRNADPSLQATLGKINARHGELLKRLAE